MTDERRHQITLDLRRLLAEVNPELYLRDPGYHHAVHLISSTVPKLLEMLADDAREDLTQRAAEFARELERVPVPHAMVPPDASVVFEQLFGVPGPPDVPEDP